MSHVAGACGGRFFDCRHATLLDCNAPCNEKGSCEAAYVSSEGHLLRNPMGDRTTYFDEAAYICFSPTYFLYDDWCPFVNALGQAFTLLYYGEVCVT